MPALLTNDVEPAELVDRLLHKRFPRHSKSATLFSVGDRGAARGPISSTTCVGRTGVGPLARVAAAEVVDDDLGAFAGEQQRVLAPDAAAGAGDDRDPARLMHPSATPFGLSCRRPPPARR